MKLAAVSVFGSLRSLRSLRSRAPTTVVMASLALSLVTGCASQKPAMKAAVPSASTTSATNATSGADDAEARAREAAAMRRGEAPVVVSPNLSVSSEIARACHLEAQRATPEFAFDSASIATEDRELLSTLAKCMADGELRGKQVELTGRTDPRGESEYNMSLGESRADTVRRYLHDLGVAEARLHATSRGEIDASGQDESSWAHDRRVDIDLVN